MTLINNGAHSRAPLPAINFYNANGCNPYTGYGKLELSLARALTNAGVRLNVYPDPDAPTLVIGRAERLLADHIAHTRRYILTQSESTRVSQRWVDLINWHAELVFVTNPDLVAIYQESGVKRPVVCARHGIDLRVPVQASGWDGESRFEWLTYTYGDKRKGGELAMMAFKNLFQHDERHHLTVKVRDVDGWIPAVIKGDDPQLTFVTGQQSEREWMELIARSHCFLFPSRAEGFGMPPREATLAGVPTIATQWLGMADVDCWGLPIKVREMQRSTYGEWDANAEGSLWAEPDMTHLKKQMRWVHEHYAEAREKARRGGWYLREHNNWTGMADIIMLEMAR
jgi:glycosyltransferase involved in cell wall biosynthesis